MEKEEKAATLKVTLLTPPPLLRDGAERPCNGTVQALWAADKVKESRRMCSRRVKATCRASQCNSKLKATVWILVEACGYCGLVSGALKVMVLM